MSDYALIPMSEAPPVPSNNARQKLGRATALKSLNGDNVLREVVGTKNLVSLRSAWFGAAVAAGIPITTWVVDGTLYIKLRGEQP